MDRIPQQKPDPESQRIYAFEARRRILLASWAVLFLPFCAWGRLVRRNLAYSSPLAAILLFAAAMMVIAPILAFSSYTLIDRANRRPGTYWGRYAGLVGSGALVGMAAVIACGLLFSCAFGADALHPLWLIPGALVGMGSYVFLGGRSPHHTRFQTWVRWPLFGLVCGLMLAYFLILW